MNYGKLSEKLKIDTEVLHISSGAGSTSRNYDMQGYPQAAIAVAVEGSYIGGVTLDLMESSQATAAGTSACGSKAGITIGGTANTYVDVANGVRQLTLTYGTDSTGATGDAITLSVGTVSKTFIFSTATANHNATAWTSTKLYFGSTVGSTVNTGAQLSLDVLRTAIVSTIGFGNALSVSTPATNTMLLTVNDEAGGAIGFGATGSTAFLVAMVNQAAGVFDIKADQMTSTASKRHLSVKVSTASTACRAAVTVIRSGGRYMPPAFKGKVSS